MIQPLRTIHRWVFTGFAVLLPAVVIVGVAKRHQHVETEQLRTELLTSTPINSQRGQFRLDIVDDVVELNATSSTPRPELLVYWSPQSAQSSLPSDATLLGTYRAGARFDLPRESVGTVVLYSPTQNSVIDSIPVGRPR